MFGFIYKLKCTVAMELKKHFPDVRGLAHISIGKESVCKCRRTLFHSWVRKISWRRGRLSTPVLLGFPCGSAGKESAYNARDLGLIPGLGRSLGEGMATHFSILAWEIPWTEVPGRLQSMGSQSVRND